MKSLAKVFSAAVIGLEAIPIEVEVDLGRGLPSFNIVGLPDKAVEESRERVKSAIKNSGFQFPKQRVIVNLAPADLKKEGPAYDLPIALAILLASGQLKTEFEDSLLVGELSLDGRLRHINGILAIADLANKKNLSLVLPHQDAREASLIREIELVPSENLAELVAHLIGEKILSPFEPILWESQRESPVESDFDLKFIKGQEFAKRALEISASGGHNLLMTGPPGAGKTILARALTTILPLLTPEETLEVSRIYSVTGLLSRQNPLIQTRPFRNPHHTVSAVAMVGGGSFPKPGEISLAHRGVLFLDELPEFPRYVLEALRQPLEDRVLTISRAQGSLTFPADFILIAAQNPCPCGFKDDPVKACICSASDVLRYKKRVSGPLLDRIDLHVEVPRIEYRKLTEAEGEESALARKRVARARARQTKRLKSPRTNANLKTSELKKFCRLKSEGEALLEKAVTELHLSPRVYTRILKVARTIADLEGKENIEVSHLAEALQYRPKEG